MAALAPSASRSLKLPPEGKTWERSAVAVLVFNQKEGILPRL